MSVKIGHNYYLFSNSKLINNALENGYSWSGNNSIPNYIVTRQTISSKIKGINYNHQEDIKKKETPNVIYIEADEVHANLQSREKGTKNRIVPVILTHEGHKEDFVKKKQLKEQHIATEHLMLGILERAPETSKKVFKSF